MKGQMRKPEIGKGEIPKRSGSAAAPGDVAVEPYIDKHEVARRLGSAVRTVDRMMRRGMIPYYKLGYRVAFRWSEIQARLVETCRVVAGEKRKDESPKTEISKTKTN